MRPDDRSAALTKRRNQKMSESSHAYVRGNTVKYYEWLASLKAGTLPEGRQSGFAAIAISPILVRWPMRRKTSKSKSGTSTKQSSEIPPTI